MKRSSYGKSPSFRFIIALFNDIVNEKAKFFTHAHNIIAIIALIVGLIRNYSSHFAFIRAIPKPFLFPALTERLNGAA